MKAQLRWLVKKSARFLVALCGGALNWLNPNKPSSAYVLTYHRFGADKQDPFCVSLKDFEGQMKLLSDEGRAINLDQLEAFVADGAPLPADACLVTIDDGLLSTYTVALPVLERYRIPAVIFVSSNLIGREFPDIPERYMTWEELRATASSHLIEVGSHAHTHRSLGNLAQKEMVEEAQLSKSLLEEQLQQPVRVFAYPFGTVGDFNEITDRALTAAGYSVAFNSIHGAVSPDLNLVSLPRVKVEGGESKFLFGLISHGATAAWRHIDRNLWRFQRVREEIQ